MDLFSRNFASGLGHKYWDGSAWQPASGKGFEESDIEDLGGFIKSDGNPDVAATSWSEDRLDV